MSYYDDEPRRYSNVRTRPRERGEPDYVVEETYIERGNGPGPRGPPPGRGELVYRGRDDSVEDIPRDFPPPRGSAVGGRGDYQRRSSYRSEYEDDRYSRRAKSTGGGRSRYSDDYDDDRRTDYGTAAAAGAAGYAAGRHREKDRRRRRDRDYDSEYSSRSRSRTPPRKEQERRKSGIEEVLGGLGLGGVVGALSGKKDKDKDRSRSDSRSRVTGKSGRSRSRAASRRRHSSTSSSSRSRDRGDGKKNTEKKWAQAAQAAILAGAVEAFRSRKEPGPWTGDRGKRIATAAIGAGGIDGLLDRNPNEKSKRHLAEAVLGGLAANRLANGPRSKSRGRATSGSPDGRSPDARPPSGLRARSRSVIDRLRGRSQSRGRPGSDAGEKEGGGAGNALKGLAAGGALAAAGKAIYDRVRSKSRKRDSRSRSSSADSYVPSRKRRRDRRGSPQSDTGTTRQSRAGGTGQSRDLASQDTNGNGALVGAGAGAGAGALATRSNGNGDMNDDASSNSSSTTDMEKKRKHMRGKELLTAGLATIATIHAAHGVYSSMEAHEKRHKLVAEGEMSPEEARKKQTKAWVQDAAAVGIAALGIKGAFSEWKEMNEQRYAPSPRSLILHRRLTDHCPFSTDARSRRSRSGRRNVGRSARCGRSARSRSAGTRSCRWRSRTRRRPWR